jgi:hypothetical protein
MSTVISRLLREAKETALPAPIAYFFFDFKEPNKQTADEMLRSLILQIIKQDEAAFQDFESYYQANKAFSATCSASSEEMLTMLHDMVKNLNRSYFIIDGLDECQDLNILMTLLGDFAAICDENMQRSYRWLMSSQDVLAVSQNLPADSLILSMEKDRVDADIDSYVLLRLESDPQLRTYSTEKKSLISEALSSQSQGV